MLLEDQKTAEKIKEGIYKNLSYTNQDFESIMLQMIDIVENNSSENKWNNLTEADPITMLLAIVARKLDYVTLRDVCYDTAKSTAMIVFIVIAATAYSLIFKRLGGDYLIMDIVSSISHKGSYCHN